MARLNRGIVTFRQRTAAELQPKNLDCVIKETTRRQDVRWRVAGKIPVWLASRLKRAQQMNLNSAVEGTTHRH